MAESKPRTLQAIIEDIRKLDSKERELLDDMLLHEGMDAVEDEEIAQAWVEECDRRIKLIEAGKMELIPAEDVIARLRARLNSMDS